MNTQDQMKEIVKQVRSSADRLEAMVESELSAEEKVEGFAHEIACSMYNIRIDRLIRQLMREQDRARQEIDGMDKTG